MKKKAEKHIHKWTEGWANFQGWVLLCECGERKAEDGNSHKKIMVNCGEVRGPTHKELTEKVLELQAMIVTLGEKMGYTYIKDWQKEKK